VFAAPGQKLKRILTFRLSQVMTNLETISYYEKLHDLFERVHPSEMPKKLGKLIEYLENAGKHHSVDVGDVTSILVDMQDAFEKALESSPKALLLTHDKSKYSVNLYPIVNFLKDNTSIDGELDQLKSRIMELAHASNVSQMKDMYRLADLVSITFEAAI
jgi:predicted transcriptional regulator